MAPFGFFHRPLTWLSSNVRNVSPVVASRSKARYKNVAAAWGSAWLQPLTMFAFPGVTPPPELIRPQPPGADSLSPPSNVLSLAWGSGELITFVRFCQSRVVGRKCSLQNDSSVIVGVV